MSVEARRNAKDSVFRDFFKRTENLLELYKVLHPEDTSVTADMLSNVTIENVLKEYPAAHEREVTSIMMALFNEETIQKAYGKQKYDEGKDEQAKATALNLHEAGMADSMIAKMIGYAESVVSSWVAQYNTKTV